VQRVRRPDDPQRKLLQMRKLRRDEWVQLAASLRCFSDRATAYLSTDVSSTSDPRTDTTSSGSIPICIASGCRAASAGLCVSRGCAT
jgi:hypothetical protein